MTISPGFNVLAPLAIFLLVGFAAGCADAQSGSDASGGDGVQVRHDEAAQRVDVVIDGDLFTSYVFSDTLTMLKKPVLYPIHTADGRAITRGYPLDPREGERVDHPHHIGLWLNYGDVNGLDFWNNSDAVSAERAAGMGTIRHSSIAATSSGETGELDVAAEWVSPEGDVLLDEQTRYVFRTAPGLRIIDRITQLSALDERVSFDDNKEGMLGLRVTRALEMPASRAVKVVGPDGGAIESTDNEGVTGHYANSEGVEGYPDVWGQRAKWLSLSGMLEGDSVAVAILDHPSNVGHPTYWHARDYGLFAANPLGQAVFSDGEETLNFALEAGESTTFRHRIVIADDAATPGEIESWYSDYETADLGNIEDDLGSAR